MKSISFLKRRFTWFHFSHNRYWDTRTFFLKKKKKHFFRELSPIETSRSPRLPISHVIKGPSSAKSLRAEILLTKRHDDNFLRSSKVNKSASQSNLSPILHEPEKRENRSWNEKFRCCPHGPQCREFFRSKQLKLTPDAMRLSPVYYHRRHRMHLPYEFIGRRWPTISCPPFSLRPKWSRTGRETHPQAGEHPWQEPGEESAIFNKERKKKEKKKGKISCAKQSIHKGNNE